jgi:ankyrin repeat protein
VFPNPQDAIRLPHHPDVSAFERVVEGLLDACRTADSSAIRKWATEWIQSLASQPTDSASPAETEIAGLVDEVDAFARRTLTSGAGSEACRLADAQSVIARAHGFPSWPALVEHVVSLAKTSSAIAKFEAAVEAIIAGDLATLQRLLHEQPALVRARSTREHQATLLHYVSANGVENYRQISPKNAAVITEALLAAGAEVDAEANVYGGGCTALGLVATSAPPANAGVQIDLIDVLLRNGAKLDHNGAAGNAHALVRGCLANGQPAAAAYLVSRGAPLDLPSAAGLGRLDRVKACLDADPEPRSRLAGDIVKESFSLACAYGHPQVVSHFLELGFNVDEELRGHGEGHTGLHVAAYHGHADVVETLLRHGAAVDVNDKTWGTPPLIWALTGWKGRPSPDARYYEVVERLVGAGATVTPKMLEWERAGEDPTMLAALRSRASL